MAELSERFQVHPNQSTKLKQLLKKRGWKITTPFLSLSK